MPGPLCFKSTCTCSPPSLGHTGLAHKKGIEVRSAGSFHACAPCWSLELALVGSPCSGLMIAARAPFPHLRRAFKSACGFALPIFWGCGLFGGGFLWPPSRWHPSSPSEKGMGQATPAEDFLGHTARSRHNSAAGIGIFPLRTPLTTVVGAPIAVQKYTGKEGMCTLSLAAASQAAASSRIQTLVATVLLVCCLMSPSLWLMIGSHAAWISCAHTGDRKSEAFKQQVQEVHKE